MPEFGRDRHLMIVSIYTPAENQITALARDTQTGLAARRQEGEACHGRWQGGSLVTQD